jgi:two-component system, probable response regulator PhcQ
MNRILLVDDEQNNLNAMRRVLRNEDDCEVESYISGHEALQRAKEITFDVVVSDYRMPDIDGAELLESFRHLQPDTWRIISSAYNDATVLRNIIDRGHIHRFIQKPWDGFLLVQAIREGIEYSHDRQELSRLRRRVEHLEGLLQQVAAQQPDLLPANWSAD